MRQERTKGQIAYASAEGLKKRESMLISTEYKVLTVLPRPHSKFTADMSGTPFLCGVKEIAHGF